MSKRKRALRDSNHDRATFEVLADGRAKVTGALDFWTVSSLLPLGTRAIRQQGTVAIDLSGVGASDSAGLALLIEWLSIAHAGGLRLRFENLPSQLRQLAGLSDVEDLIAAG